MLINRIKRCFGINETYIQVHIDRAAKELIEDILNELTTYKCKTNMWVDEREVVIYISTLAYKRAELVCSLYRKANDFDSIGTGDFCVSF